MLAAERVFDPVRLLLGFRSLIWWMPFLVSSSVGQLPPFQASLLQLLHILQDIRLVRLLIPLRRVGIFYRVLLLLP